MSKNTNKNSYVTEVLKNITPEFYNQYLKNTTQSSYIDFLNNKKVSLNSALNKTVATNRDKKILNVLPSYSDSNDGTLTDFKFISYIEALANTFNFKYNDPIGIKNIVLMKDFSIDSSNKSWLETNLYYIPVKISIVITKKDLVNLLHYVEKVGNISIEDNGIKVYEDDFLNKNGRKVVLDGYNYNQNWPLATTYNIYENQMMNIEDIKMKDYLDSSPEYRKDMSYVDFIKSTQPTDPMEVDLKLKFFIKWQPNYQLEAIISGILDRYSTLSTQVSKKLSSNDISVPTQVKLKQANTYLKEISKDITDIKKDFKNKQMLNEVYKRSIAYDSIFNNIETLLK